MIVYNVRHRFFAMKNDAEAHRKQHGLPPDATHKIVVENREELAGFLDALFQYAAPDNGTPPAQDAPVAAQIAAYAPPEAPDWVPEFIKRDWERRASYNKEK